MIVFDVINDEAPLFIEAARLLPAFDTSKKDILFVTEGNRWRKEANNLTTSNRLHFFDDLDKQSIDIEKELQRISIDYNNFNIYSSDRYLIKKNRVFQKKMLVYTYLFFEKIFNDNVTHYFTTGIAYTYNLISFQVSKRFNVKHISFYGIRLANRTAISFDNRNTFDEVTELYDNFKPSKVTSEMYKPIHTFLNRPVQPSYMTNAINSSKLETIFIKEFFIRFRKFYLSNRHHYDFFTRNPFELALFKAKKIVTAKKVNLLHNAVFDKVNKKDKYYIFPLHMQPEASTLILSPFYVNQKECIINISKLLPPDTYLYVKEHKSALGQHNFKFYKELKKHPNIKLISFKESMFNLIQNAIGTINLSSTVGLESLIIKKPAIILGNVFYNDSGLTFRVDSYLQLKEVLKEINTDNYKLENSFENYDERLAYYLYALQEKSYPFEFNVAKMDTKKKVMTKNNILAFSECIEKIMFYK